MVSDTELVERLHEILRSSDLDTTTPGSVRRQLEEAFGVDLSDKKAYIRGQIDLFLDTLHANESDNANGKEDDGVEGVGNAPESDAGTVEDEKEESEEDEEAERMQKRAKKEGKKPRGGFAKVCSLSPKLQAIVGEPELARTEVVKRMWVYIREKNLQDPNNRKNIICDDALHDLFRVKSINMFQMNKALSKHIWPLDSDHVQKSNPDEEDTACSLQEEEEEEVEKKQRKPRGRKRGSDAEQSNVKKRGGFNKLYRLSPKLRELTGAEEMGRTDVVKFLWGHIRAKNLQDPSDKRRILCDESLRSIFDVESIGMFQMNKELSKHLLPIDENASKMPKKEIETEENDDKDGEESESDQMENKKETEGEEEEQYTEESSKEGEMNSENSSQEQNK